MGTTGAESALETLLSRVPPEVMDSLSEEERIALWQAVNPVTWRKHPINIRITVPGLANNYFLTVVGGVEKRGHERIRRERRVHPLRTAGNILFLLGLGGSFYLVAVMALVAFSFVDL